VTDPTERLSDVPTPLPAAATRAGRSADEITIVAVSKLQSASSIEEAYRAGERNFGESYVQEALAKIEALAGLDIVWHFIGRVQANKTRAIAERFQWVHTVDRERIARRLSEQRPYHAAPLNVLIQVNLEGEPQKAGATPDDAARLANIIVGLDGLKLRGLMTIPPAGLEAAETARHFEHLAELRNRLDTDGFDLDTLSMGMSGDFEAAIEAGSTCVRIGTSIFGSRSV
jgi:PLP dependent protein